MENLAVCDAELTDAKNHLEHTVCEAPWPVQLTESEDAGEASSIIKGGASDPREVLP